jgi:hypothetical protein
MKYKWSHYVEEHWPKLIVVVLLGLALLKNLGKI